MLNIKQRLVGLYVLYEIYLHENVKTTPFYQLVLDLLGRAATLHVAEQHLLTDFVKSVPKIAKQTTTAYIAEAEKKPAPQLDLDLEPYRKAHKENMPKTSILGGSALIPLIRDVEEEQHDSLMYPAFNFTIREQPGQSVLDEEELQLRGFHAGFLRPAPVAESEQDYLLVDVLYYYSIDLI